MRDFLAVIPERLTTAMMALVAASLCSAAEETTPESAFPAGIQLPAKARGEAAIAALGAKLPELAAFHDKSPRQLREMLLADETLWINPRGELFYACPPRCGHCAHESAPGGDETARRVGPTDPGPFDTSEAFLLHSRPGASRLIYLDFDGHADASGRWKDGAESPPFDLDGNEATFNATELNRIIGIWQRVAEDFSMYDIDVTTEDPGVEALRKANPGDTAFGIRVVIGGSSNDWFGGGAGGVAFVGSFDSNQDVPCWVFPKAPGSGISEKNISEAASHEAGHTLGLFHDGIDGGTTYYAGQGNWAPIMGVSYGKPISQWSKGEYADANNGQDDLAVMLTQGAVYRPDDHGDTTGTATAISSDADSVAAAGVIERDTDSDFFRVEAAAGTLEIDALPSPRGPNLRLQVKLYDAGGALLQTATSSDTSAGTRPVTLTRPVTAGDYFISVEGIGNGDPLTTGYSDYASVGQFDLLVTGVVPGGSTWMQTAPGSHQWDLPTNWASADPPAGAGSLARINNDISGNQTIQLAIPTTIGRLVLGDADSSHGFTIASIGGSLIFDNDGAAAELSKTVGGSDAVAAPTQLTSDLILTQTASGTLSFSGGIGGAGSMTKAGAGTVVFGAGNSYGGATTLANGLLRLDTGSGLPGGIDNAVGSGESALVFSGGVLGLADGDFTRQLGTGAGQLNWLSGTGGFAAFGADREIRLNNGTGAVSWASAIIGGGNTLILGHPSSTHTIDFKNGISFAGSQRTIEVRDGQAPVDARLSGALFGNNSSGMKKTGTGVLSLTKANTYSGATTVDGGVLRLQNAGALPSGNLELTGGGILGLGAGDLTTRTLGTGTDQVRWSGEAGFAAFGAERAVKFSNSSINWVTANFIGSTRALILGHDTADATLDWQQKISLAGSLRIIQVNDGSADIDAKMSGVVAGGLAETYTNDFDKNGAGTLAFTAQNTYRGDTIVSLGILMIGDGGTSGGISRNCQSIFVDSGATLAVNRSDTVTQGTDPLIAPISGNGGFAQVGGGTTVLTLANTYTGPTAIDAGTLALGIDHVLPDTSPVIIGDATLDAATFSDTAGTLAVNGNATIRLGIGGTLRFADSHSLDWSGGTLMIDGEFIPGVSLRFGSDTNGLAATQLASITAPGFESFALDSDGFLTATAVGGYEAWAITQAGGQGPGLDFDDDGVANGIEYVLGGSGETRDAHLLPTIDTPGNEVVFSFIRDQGSIDGATTVTVEVGGDLIDWPTVYPVPDNTVANNPGITVEKDTPQAGKDRVTLTLPRSPGQKAFFRLRVTP